MDKKRKRILLELLCFIANSKLKYAVAKCSNIHVKQDSNIFQRLSSYEDKVEQNKIYRINFEKQDKIIIYISMIKRKRQRK